MASTKGLFLFFVAGGVWSDPGSEGRPNVTDTMPFALMMPALLGRCWTGFGEPELSWGRLLTRLMLTKDSSKNEGVPPSLLKLVPKNGSLVSP